MKRYPLRDCAMAAFTAAPLLSLSLPAAGQTCLPPGNNDWTAWLTSQENAGGHALACHVNVTINGLIGRLENRNGHRGPACLPGGAAASSFSSIKSLIDVIKPVIVSHAEGFKNNRVAGDYQFNGTADGTIGTVVSVFNGSKNNHPCPPESIST